MDNIEESDELLNNVYYIINGEKNWHKLLQYSETINLNQKRKLLWAWPSESNLLQIKQILLDLGISCILSVGCGCGILEWLLQECIGGDFKIFGIESDRSWWQSKYAVKSFIELNYYEDLNEENFEDSQTFLQKSCHVNDWNFCLLFSYFNNRAAFLNYLKMYCGKCIILIGPRPEISIHTDPNPLEPNFPVNAKWELLTTCEIIDNNIFALYVHK